MVSFVLREHTLEILTILGTEDRIGKGRVTQLNLSVRNLLHTESCIVQIYRVTDLIVPCWFFGNRGFHNFGRLCHRRFWLNRIHRSYGLPNFFQIVIGKPFVREVFRNAFRVYIVVISLAIPDCILAILGINHCETVINIFQRINLGFFDSLSFRFFLRAEVASLSHQTVDSLHHLRPGHLQFIAAALGVSNTLGIVILTAVRCAGASVGMTTGSVFMLQEIHLFFGRMILLPVVINTGFATGKATSTGQVCIDFIIRNELVDKGHLHHIGLILTQRHIQLIQLFLDEIQLVIVKTKQIGIFRKGFSKFRILLHQGCVETRVIQLFSQVCGFIRKPTKRFLMENCQIAAGTGFFTQIVIKMPQGFSQLLTLISGSFYQFHIGCELTIFKKFSNTLGNRFPRNDLRSGTVNGRGTFGKVDTVLAIPRTDIPTIFFQTIAAVIDLL